MTEFHWTTPLMTSYSKQMRAGITIDAIIKDMKGTFDPKGGYMVKDSKVKSVVHNLG